MIKIINLASGSDGNLTYIESDQARILIDAGLSCTQIVRRLALLNVNPEQIDAIFVTHEHLDHIKGVDVFCSKYNKPVYAHREVFRNLDEKLLKVERENRKMFENEFLFKDLKITAFPVPHDVPCFGYSIENNDKKVSILTDFGHTNDRILSCIQKSQIVYLESNYDKKMLSKNEKYPLILKRRIAGPNGHLSNDDSAELIKYLVLSGTRQIVLSHLSKDNNTPSLAFETVAEHLLEFGIIEGVHVKIDVASTKPGVMFKLN